MPGQKFSIITLNFPQSLSVEDHKAVRKEIKSPINYNVESYIDDLKERKEIPDNPGNKSQMTLGK